METLQITLTEETIARLRQEAARRGDTSAEAFVATLVTERLTLPTAAEFDLTREEEQAYVDSVHQARAAARDR